jgi:hypothetical protein
VRSSSGQSASHLGGQYRGGVRKGLTFI